MADLSLDDYINKGRIGRFKNRPLPGGSKNNGQKSAFKYSPVIIGKKARKKAATTSNNNSVKNRLGKKPGQNVAFVKKFNLMTKKNIDARARIVNKNRLTDARQKILQKEKLVDARLKIRNNLAKKKNTKPDHTQKQRPASAPANVAFPKITIKNRIAENVTGRPDLIARQTHKNVNSKLSIKRTIPKNSPVKTTIIPSRTIGNQNVSEITKSATITRTVPKNQTSGILSRSGLLSQPVSGLYSATLKGNQQTSSVLSKSATLLSRTIGNDSFDEMDTDTYSPKENFVITRPVGQQQISGTLNTGFSPMIRIQNDQYVEPSPGPVLKQPPLVTTRTHKAAVRELKKSDVEDVDIISPLQGFKVMVTNLHPIVSQDDIVELFGALGPLKKGRLLKKGVAEIVFQTKEHALMSVKKYNNRELDGLPMTVRMATPANAKIPDDDIEGLAKHIKPSSDLKPLEYMELDMASVQKALFKVSSRSANTPSPKPVSFTVKI